jgi:hypothetical protein
MGFFRKKRDPISEKAQALNAQIETLQAQIKKLEVEAAAPQPRFRSSALPRNYSAPAPVAKREVPRREHFEKVDHTPLQSPEPQAKPKHELGMRKYNFLAAWQRLKSSFKGPPASNPKLVNYLAAGSIQGLRPLRYEKRVARNRFVLLVIVLLLLLWGTLVMFFRH